MSKPRKPPRVFTHILCIDPAKAAGVCVRELATGRYIFAAPAAGDSIHPLSLVVSRAMATLPKTANNEVLAVFETGWLANRSVKSGLTLAIRRGLALAAAELAGITAFEWINPSTWQHALFEKGWKGKRDTKELSTEYAQRLLSNQGGDITVANDDVADAICIAHYAATCHNVTQ